MNSYSVQTSSSSSTKGGIRPPRDASPVGRGGKGQGRTPLMGLGRENYILSPVRIAARKHRYRSSRQAIGQFIVGTVIKGIDSW